MLLVAGERLVGLIFPHGKFLSAAKTVVTSGIIAIACLALAPGVIAVATSTAVGQLFHSSTYFALNKWAASALPPKAKILFDDLAYFDPKIFPNAKMNGGVLTWSHIFRSEPEFVVISSSLYDAAWYQELRRTQHLAELDSNPVSVRLYQDLLASDNLGATKVQGVDFIQAFSASPIAVTRPEWSLPASIWPATWLSLKLWQIDAGARSLMANVMAAGANSSIPNNGVTLRLYKMNPPGEPNGRPVSIASSETKEYPARYAFDGTTPAWRASDLNKSFKGEYIGYDFGDHSARRVAGVEISWINYQFTLSTLRVEYSDDRSTWTLAGQFSIPHYAASDPPFRLDRFTFDVGGAHRFWRVVDDDGDVAYGFGIADITFLEAE